VPRTVGTPMAARPATTKRLRNGREMTEVASQDQVLGELVERTGGMQIWRRVFHVICGLLLAATVLWLPVPRNVLLGSLALLFAGSLSVDLIRLYLPSVNRLFYRLFPSLLTPRDADRLASSTWYLLGVLLAFLLFPERIAVAATLVLAVADPAGNVVGRTLGKRPFGTGTVAGTLALVVASFLVTWPLVGVLPAAVAALVAGVVETRDIGLDDNLTVPLGAALTLWAMSFLA